MSCFLGLPFQSWVVQELALFGGCGKNWGEMRCFVRPVLTPSPFFIPISQKSKLIFILIFGKTNKITKKKKKNNNKLTFP